jgi:hypothetical protein
MPTDAKSPEGFSLKRWSRRKHEAVREAAPVAVPPRPTVPPNSPLADAPAAATPAPRPPVDSLTADSDFTAFLQPEVDEAVKRQALKKLFADPRFNVMDGLDVYIDDYTKTVPIPPDVLERLMANITFSPPVAPEEKPQVPAAEAANNAAPAPSDSPAQVADKSADSADTDPQDSVPRP